MASSTIILLSLCCVFVKLIITMFVSQEDATLNAAMDILTKWSDSQWNRP